MAHLCVITNAGGRSWFLQNPMAMPTRPHGLHASRSGKQRPLLQMKTPPTSEDVDGVFHAFTSRKVAALDMKTLAKRIRSREKLNPYFAIAAASVPLSSTKVGQIRALAFELLLGFLEACDTRRNFGSIAREPLFPFRHCPVLFWY
jgi:hypothetical protein